ncbi:GRAM domain-containing protein 2A isoform X1 [Trachypithecus francoisi]|uniref:GRAM domain-containing protein 2A isoform X1 n=1 Tax=Trachypithecus francoisi TaxID=54180 RepID=UPI00141B63CD|nr:GRAM domain-containing protein 2A isoform X1 [Trachypithecus francoisi]
MTALSRSEAAEAGSNQQMHGKTASLNSAVPCKEKPDRVEEPLDYSLHWPEGLKEEIKKCGREGITLNKYNQQYHKLFKDVPLEEVVLKVCSCALQRDLLLQGRLYISPNWLCFHASLFGRDIKVVIPVVSVQMIKKHKMARLLPNGLAITTNTSQKYIFVSLLSRDSVYDLLRRVCTHLQPSSKKSLSVREFPGKPESLEVLIPEMKWRKVCPSSRSLSLPDNIPCIPPASVASTDSFFPSRKPSRSEKSRTQVASENGGKWAWPMPGWGPACPKKMTNCSPTAKNAVYEEDELEEEPRSTAELTLWDYRLLKDLLPGHVLILSGVPYFSARAAVMHLELERPSPWAQVTATWPLSPFLLQEECSGC